MIVIILPLLRSKGQKGLKQWRLVVSVRKNVVLREVVSGDEFCIQKWIRLDWRINDLTIAVLIDSEFWVHWLDLARQR